MKTPLTSQPRLEERNHRFFASLAPTTAIGESHIPEKVILIWVNKPICTRQSHTGLQHCTVKIRIRTEEVAKSSTTAWEEKRREWCAQYHADCQFAFLRHHRKSIATSHLVSFVQCLLLNRPLTSRATNTSKVTEPGDLTEAGAASSCATSTNYSRKCAYFEITIKARKSCETGNVTTLVVNSVLSQSDVHLSVRFCLILQICIKKSLALLVTKQHKRTMDTERVTGCKLEIVKCIVLILNSNFKK